MKIWQRLKNSCNKKSDFLNRTFDVRRLLCHKKLTKSAIIVCDTDVVTDAHKKRFVSNINKLAKLTNNKIHILVHKLNFEDELAYAALYKDKTLLYKAYKVEGEKDFKKKFAQSRNIRKGLEALHIEVDKL